ncbi:MAG: hypothetical protein K0R39_157 [Symbiobacteriaceae bacterium]|jgi:hypothetical protein|nr:hypothetical protein [Symbiobacteriaceae bacterium]
MTEALAQRLLDEVLAGGSASPRLSVIGLCKNAGKTVTLNHVIQAAAHRGLPLGLVSTGRDGEEQDAITELPKPRIWAPAGAWVATARGALGAGTAEVSTVAELPMMTPFGPVVIGRVERDGEVLLIGPGSVARINSLLTRLEAHGARLSLVDGSFDRLAAAAPAVTGRVVLAAGAAYSTSMAETVAQVRHVLDIFDLPQAPHPNHTNPHHSVSIIHENGTVTAINASTALGDPEPIIEALTAHSGGYLALHGALGDRLISALLRRRPPLAGVIVQDPTRVLVERNLWRRWRRQGGTAYVRQPAQLIAITTNPYSPVGQDYPARAFHQAIKDIANRPVFDLQAGLSPEEA